MPVLVQHGDAALTGQFAYQTGKEVGKTAQRIQQQQLDQSLILQHLAQAHEARMNAGPSFAERSRMADARNGSGYREGVGNYRQSVGEGSPSVDPMQRVTQKRQERELKDANRARQNELLASLEKQVPEEQRGLDFQVTKQAILSGQQPTEAMLRNVRPAKETQEEDGQPYEPSTAFGKSVQQRIARGGVAELADRFSEREAPENPLADSGPLTREALEARAVLSEWTRRPSTSDAELQAAAEEMSAGETADTWAKSEIEAEIERRKELQRQVQYPVVLEGARASAAAQASRFYETNQRAPTVTEQRQMLAKAFEAQAKALNIDSQDYREWMSRQTEQENALKAAQAEADAAARAEMQKAIEKQRAENEAGRGKQQDAGKQKKPSEKPRRDGLQTSYQR